MTEDKPTPDTADGRPKMGPRSKLAVDLGPAIVFFGVYFKFGIMAATAVLMAGIVIAQAYAYSVERRIAPMGLVTGVVVLIFGGLTLFLNDDLFIKLKPTIVNMIFATLLFAGHLMGRPFIKYLLQDSMPLKEEGWRKLTYRFIGFFVFLAVLNEIVWRNFSTDVWVTFKVWGNIPLTFLYFAIFVIPLVMRYQISEDENAASEENSAKENGS